jgi:hypothetical protein
MKWLKSDDSLGSWRFMLLCVALFLLVFGVFIFATPASATPTTYDLPDGSTTLVTGFSQQSDASCLNGSCYRGGQSTANTFSWNLPSVVNGDVVELKGYARVRTAGLTDRTWQLRNPAGTVIQSGTFSDNAGSGAYQVLVLTVNLTATNNGIYQVRIGTGPTSTANLDFDFFTFENFGPPATTTTTAAPTTTTIPPTTTTTIPATTTTTLLSQNPCRWEDGGITEDPPLPCPAQSRMIDNTEGMRGELLVAMALLIFLGASSFTYRFFWSR